MKSIKIFATVGAIALLGMAGLSSCKTNNGPEDPGAGNYSGETVKTEFLISLSDNAAGDGSVRKMPGSTVQIDLDGPGDPGYGSLRNEFRGMDSIVIVPFGENWTTRIGKNIVLSPIPQAAATTSGKLNAAQNIFYSDVAIPIGTKQMLFYGKAIDNDPGVAITSDADKHQFGIVRANGLYAASNDPSAISFDLVKIYPTTGVPAHAQELADYLTGIAKANVGTALGDSLSTFTETNGGNDGVYQLYLDLISMKAGSASAILAAAEDLYNSLERFQELSVTPSPVVAAAMTAILNGTDITAATAGDGFKMKRKLEWESAMGFKDYPRSIGLPDGAAYVYWQIVDGSHTIANGYPKFLAKAGDDVTLGSETGAYEFGKLTNFVYPVSLQYFAKSTIGVSTKSQKDNYDGSKDWPTIYAEYTDAGTVKSNTKSVAIKDTIQYGVAQLNVNIRRAAVTLKDNDDNEFTTGDAALKWKGVLVGGQKQVNYEFETNTSEDAYTIYDNDLHGKELDGLVTIPNTNTYVPNYTLVFSTQDNKTGGGTPDNDAVYIVVELVNTLGDFIGKDNKLIPEGCTFYLVAKIDASAASGVTLTKHPKNYNLFYKDYVTTVNLTINANSLKNAYYTIPDLRSSGLELGFSVDLSWKDGIIFDIDL